MTEVDRRVGRRRWRRADDDGGRQTEADGGRQTEANGGRQTTAEAGSRRRRRTDGRADDGGGQTTAEVDRRRWRQAEDDGGGQTMTEAGGDRQTRGFLTLVIEVLLPSLSLLPCNCCMSEEVWSFLRLFKYEHRLVHVYRYVFSPSLFRRSLFHFPETSN